MRRIAIGLLGVLTMCVVANAADMPVKARPTPVPAIYNWTGLYVGAQVGWSHINDSQFLSSPTFTLNVTDSADGVVGGLHIGYNLQTNQWVYGIEADFEGNSTNHSFVIGPPFVNTTGTEKLDWQGSVRGRLGLAFDRTLLYATGGWAFGHFSDSYNTAGTAFSETVTSTRSGWTVGGGLQYAWTNNLSLRAEYRYTAWPNHTNALNVFLAPPGTSVDRVNQNAVRVGLSYRFGP